jgi:UDP-2,3-diacylglucosamine pyrophosphatase LpxH
MSRKLIVISDLHISAGPLDDFDQDIEQHFSDFVSQLTSAEGPFEFVINGDFLDFVQAPPDTGPDLETTSSAEGMPLCYTEQQSLAKLSAIEAAHPAVFRALGSFLAANEKNNLTLLPGNHDVDLFFGGVRGRLNEVIARGVTGQFCIHLDRVYRSATFPDVWIEHGHQFDKINSFRLGEHECWSQTNAPILRDQQNRPRLVECLGTRFLIRFLNQLDREYPYVDNVKPFSVFVRLFAASALMGGYAPLRVSVIMWRLLRYLVRTGITAPTDLLSASGDVVDSTTALRERLEELNDRNKELQRRVQRDGFSPYLPLSLVLDDPKQTELLLEFLADRPDLLQGLDPDDGGYLSNSGEDGTLSLARGFLVDESRELIEGARGILARNTDTKLVIMGHTHEALNRPANLAYMNTGSWTRYFQQSASEKLRPWSLLKKGSEKHFPFAPKYAEITSAGAEQAQLFDYAVKAYAV